MGKEECTLTNYELVEKVNTGISKLCQTGGKSFTMNVPARLNEDLDLLVSEMSRRFRDMCASQEATTSTSALPISDVVQQRELLLGLLRFERKNGFETTTLVNEEIVDQYLDEL